MLSFSIRVSLASGIVVSLFCLGCTQGKKNGVNVLASASGVRLSNFARSHMDALNGTTTGTSGGATNGVLPEIGFAPQGQTIQPFGYGVVQSVLTSHSSANGTAWCNGTFGSIAPICISVSGGNNCEQGLPSGELVNCSNQPNNVDEAPFQPSLDCSDPHLTQGERDW